MPDIAKLYGVIIDDLFKEELISYDNHAHRLFSVYEKTRKREDFLAAEQEYRKLYYNNCYTMKDMCMMGILYQHGMWDCYNNAHKYYDMGLNIGIEKDNDTYFWIERQKILIEAQIGHHEENIKKYLDLLNREPNELNHYINLIESYLFSENFREALEIFLSAEKKFANSDVLYIYGGKVYSFLQKYDEAFACFEKAYVLDNRHTHALREAACLYEKLNDFEKAYKKWCLIAQWYAANGYIIEEEEAHEAVEKCKAKIR